MQHSSSTEPTLSGLRRAVKHTLYSVGYYHQRLAQFDFPGVAVLCYHSIRAEDDVFPFNQLHVTTETFERHCQFLAETCNPISLDDLRAARGGGRQLPARPVIVTFDDGYRGVLDFALPSLERHQVPAAVFACPGAVMERRHFWFDVLHRRDGEDAVLVAKRAPYSEWRALWETLRVPSDPGDLHRPMRIEELQRLAASPMIEIGAHTMIHPTLALAPVEEQWREISGSRTSLQNMLSKPVNAFAYPYGGLELDYRPETVKIVRDIGFDLAFTTDSTFAALDCDPLQIPRFVMLDSVGEVELAHRLLHSWHVAEHAY